MALTNIEYGSVASSEVVNNNFQYLEDRISSVSQSLSTNVSALSGSISALSSVVDNNKETAEEADAELQKNINNLTEEVEAISTTLDTAIYVKESYRSGHNWYRLYSDGWIEQGGYIGVGGTNATKNITLFKELADTNACIYVTGTSAYMNGNWDIGVVSGVILNTTTVRVSVGRDGSGGSVYWRVCGMCKTEET